MHIPASSREVWCDGCGIPPPRTWVRCSLTMHTGLAERESTYLQLISTLLACCFPLWVSPPSKPMSWRYLPSTSPACCRNFKAADAAHVVLPRLRLVQSLSSANAQLFADQSGAVGGEHTAVIRDQTSGTPYLRTAASRGRRKRPRFCVGEMAEARIDEVRAQRVILPCGRHVACTLPPKPAVPLVAATGFPSPLTRMLLLLGYLFQAVNHFGPVFLIMAGLTQCFHDLWSVIGMFGCFPPLDPMMVMNCELRCSLTSFTPTICSPEYLSPVGFVFRSGFVSLPHIFHCRQNVMFYLHLFQIGMGPMSLDRRSMVDELGLCRRVAPDPFSLYILSSKFISASFRPRLMWHEPSSDLFWPDAILLSQPFPEPEPDVAIEFVKGFRRVDRSVVGGPSPNDRIDGLYLVCIIVAGCTPCGHRLDLRLHPLQAFLGGAHKNAHLATIRGCIAAKNAKPQEFKSIFDMSDLGFLLGQLSSHFISEERFARLFDVLGLCFCSAYDHYPVIGVARTSARRLGLCL